MSQYSKMSRYPPILPNQCPLQQNVLMPLCCILPTYSSTKCFNTSILCDANPNFYNYSINIGFIYFFSSSDMNQSHNLIECHATGINSLLICIVSSLRFSNLMCLIKKLSWLDWKLKQFAWQKKVFFRYLLR